MKKKLIGLTLSAALAIGSFTPVLADQTASIAGDTVYVQSGEEFYMPFSAANAEKINGFLLELVYNPSYITPVNNSLIYSDTTASMQSMLVSAGKIKVMGSNLHTTTGEIKNLFSYKFKAVEGTEDEITTAISINLETVMGDDIAKVSVVNGMVNINIEAPPVEAEKDKEEEEEEKKEVEKTAQNVAIGTILDRQYGDAPFMLEPIFDTVSGITRADFLSSDESVASVNSSGLVTINGAGICEILMSVDGDDNYTPATAAQNLVVNKKVLTVYPNDLEITYGEALPKNLIAFEGFINEEDHDELAKQVVINGLPQNTVTPGTYTLTLSGINSKNYKITYLEGSLKINKKTISIDALNVFDKQADGSTAAVINPSSIVLSGVNAGDIVLVNTAAATAQFSQAGIGSDLPVKVTDLSLMGTDAEKYKLASTEFDTTANIKEVVTAEEMAARLTALKAIEKDRRTLILPNLGEAFNVAVASSSNPNLIDQDGNIGYAETDTDVTLTLAVTNGEDTAVTAPIDVTVPASTKVVVAAGTMTGTLEGTGTYYKGQRVTLTVKGGYKVTSWHVDDETIPSSDLSYSFTADQDVLVWADTYRHSGGSLLPNVAGTVTADNTKNKVVAGTTITLKTNTENAKIYYTTDGTTPTTSSNLYKDGIEITESTVIKAIAVKSGMNTSQIASFSYTIRNAETELKENANTIKYMVAYTDNTFRPDQAATRYEVINALNELLDIEEMKNNKSFSDVDSEHFDVVSKFANVGIISGYGNGTFGGNRSITRAEFVTLLTKAWNLDKKNVSNNIFTDIDDHWAAEQINAFASIGYVYGYPDGGFHPDDKVTRAEVVAVINRMLGTKSIATSQKFVDLAPTHWAYSQIMAVVA